MNQLLALWLGLLGVSGGLAACSDSDSDDRNQPVVSAQPMVSASNSAAAGSSTSAGPHSNPLSQAQIAAFVDAHNEARGGPLTPPPSPPLPPVSWDAALADVAFNYLSQCQGSALANHNANRTEDYAALGGSDYVGENIYAGTGNVDPVAAVAAWMEEAASYDYANPTAGSAGHYTQVVWRDSVRIGCALVTCPNLSFPNTVLCDYAPGGNFNNAKPY